MFQRDGGHLATEARDGAVTVVATLGMFDGREAALAREAARGQGLLRQGHRGAATDQ